MDDGNPPAVPPAPKIYVKFGKLPTQEMPREWAEEMLTMWREANPSQFGKMLAKVVTGGR